MAIEHGMNGAFGGNPDIACQPPEQELADLACAPMRLFPFEGDNQALDLLGQLVGITHWPPRAIAESLTTMLPVAVENLVAGFTRYPELPAHIRHRLPIQQPGDKAKAFFHHRTLFPRHPHLRLRKKPGSVTHVSGTMCHPSLRPHSRFQTPNRHRFRRRHPARTSHAPEAPRMRSISSNSIGRDGCGWLVGSWGDAVRRFPRWSSRRRTSAFGADRG